MIIPIIGRSAVEFWLGPAAAIFTNFSFNIHKEIVSFPENFEFQVTAEVARFVAARMWLTLPLETFSFNRNQHQIGKAMHVVTKYSPFPPNSFVHVKKFGHDFLIARPELCFLQAANYMTLPQLVHLGMKLSGLYYLQPSVKAELKKRGGKGMEQRSRSPLTTAAQIKSFLRSAAGQDGVKLARQAALYVIDEANSPMEAALATIMILPTKYGGYSMPRFTMNYPVKLSDKAAAYFGYGELRGDFYWESSHVIAEYNSKAFHMDAAQQAVDADRLNAMQQSGFKVVPITYNNLKYFDNVEKQMELLRNTLGCSQIKINLDDYKSQRQNLCRELLGTDNNFCDRFYK